MNIENLIMFFRNSEKVMRQKNTHRHTFKKKRKKKPWQIQSKQIYGRSRRRTRKRSNHV